MPETVIEHGDLVDTQRQATERAGTTDRMICPMRIQEPYPHNTCQLADCAWWIMLDDTRGQCAVAVIATNMPDH